jgi:hypothetical protein
LYYFIWRNRLSHSQINLIIIIFVPTQQFPSLQNPPDDPRGIAGTLPLGRPGLPRSHQLLYERPEHQEQPRVFTADALGTEKSGRVICATEGKQLSRY